MLQLVLSLMTWYGLASDLAWLGPFNSEFLTLMLTWAEIFFSLLPFFYITYVSLSRTNSK